MDIRKFSLFYIRKALCSLGILNLLCNTHFLMYYTKTVDKMYYIEYHQGTRQETNLFYADIHGEVHPVIQARGHSYVR